MYNQDKVKKPTSQAKNHKKIHFIQEDVPWNLFKPFPQVMSPVGMILAVSDEWSRVLDVIIRLDRKHKDVYPRQDNIAKWANVSLSTAKRAIRFYAKHGFIGVKNNGCNKSCWYKVSEFFNDLDVKKQLSKKLSIFFFTVTSLFSALDGQELRSTNVFNSIYRKLAKATLSIREVTANEERDSQRRIAKASYKKKGSSMFEPQVEIRDTIKNLGIKFTFEQQQQLSKYTDAQLLAAKQIISKKKTTRSPASLFFWLLLNEPAVKNAKQAAAVVKKEEGAAKSSYKPVYPPEPIQKFTYDENLERFGRWYTEHAEKYAAIGYRQTPEGYARRFVEKLNRLFPDPQKLETLKQNAIEIQNQFSVPTETISDDGSLASIMAKIAQQSKSNSSFAGENNPSAMATEGLSIESPKKSTLPEGFPNGLQISPTTNEIGVVKSFIENEENVECEFEFI